MIKTFTIQITPEKIKKLKEMGCKFGDRLLNADAFSIDVEMDDMKNVSTHTSLEEIYRVLNKSNVEKDLTELSEDYKNIRDAGNELPKNNCIESEAFLPNDLKHLSTAILNIIHNNKELNDQTINKYSDNLREAIDKSRNLRSEIKKRQQEEITLRANNAVTEILLGNKTISDFDIVIKTKADELLIGIHETMSIITNKILSGDKIPQAELEMFKQYMEVILTRHESLTIKKQIDNTLKEAKEANHKFNSTKKNVDDFEGDILNITDMNTGISVDFREINNKEEIINIIKKFPNFIGGIPIVINGEHGTLTTNKRFYPTQVVNKAAMEYNKEHEGDKKPKDIREASTMLTKTNLKNLMDDGCKFGNKRYNRKIDGDLIQYKIDMNTLKAVSCEYKFSDLKNSL